MILLCLPMNRLQLLFAEDITEDKKILTEEWVKDYLKGKDRADGIGEKLEKKATAIMKTGIGFYKEKNDAKAIEEYKKAILVYPTSDIYYHFANSLTNVNRTTDAIKAYKIALNLYDRNEALIYYNLACAYSRLNHLEESKTNLHLAIRSGYSAFQKIRKDPDLDNLRKLSGWDKELNELMKEYNITKSDVIGEISYQGPRSGDAYYLCSNGTFIQRTIHYCEVKYKGFLRGTWEYKTNRVETKIKETCYPSFTASKKKSDIGAAAADNIACYGKPAFTACKPSSEINLYKLSFDILYQAIKSKPEKNEEDNREYQHKKFSGGEPKECDPDFYPKDLEDYKIQ